MTIRDYTAQVLRVPTYYKGFSLLVSAIEYIYDTQDPSYYKALSRMTAHSPKYIEKAIRDAKNAGLKRTWSFTRQTNTQYIFWAADMYRKGNYENKEQ